MSGNQKDKLTVISLRVPVKDYEDAKAAAAEDMRSTNSFIVMAIRAALREHRAGQR